MPHSHLKLHGEFKVDVYDISGNLLRSSDFIKNFITNSGTLYPYYFAFADCFRYLSLGTGTGQNSTGFTMPPTTGLTSGWNGFTYLDSGSYISGGFLGGGCGNMATGTSGISLIRQWGLPDVTGGVFTGTHNFKEMMVSPGRPYVTGYNSSDGGSTWFESGACSCQEFVYSSVTGSYGSPDLTGADCSQLAAYYALLPNLQEHINNQFGASGGLRQRLRLCDAPQAFSRITGDFYVNSGEVLAITYQLNLTFNTSIQTGEYFSSVPTGADKNWNALGFAANITNPGIKLITDSFVSQNSSSIDAPNGTWRLQQIDFNNNSTFPLNQLYGESFVPSLGIPMEPSCIYGSGGNFAAYISDDNTQFVASASGGACPTGFFKPWNSMGANLPQNSGLLDFQTVMSGNTASGAANDGTDSNYWSEHPFNIRTQNSSVGYPNTSDISTVGTQIPNTYTGAQSRSYFSSGYRGGSILTNYNFPNFALNNPAGTVLYNRSFVVGYIDSNLLTSTYPNANRYDAVNIVPFFDCLFSGLSGSGNFIPTIQTGTSDNVTPTEILGFDSFNYNYLTGQNGSLYPTFSNLLSWTADCPAGVDGC